MNLLFSLFFLLCCSDKDNSQPTTTTVYRGEQSDDNSSTGNNGRSESRIEAKLGVSEPTARVPGSLLERHKKIGNTPEDAIALWIEAVIRAQNGEEEGWEAIGALTIDGFSKQRLQASETWRKELAAYFRKKLDSTDPCLRSLVVGAHPKNDYEVDMSNIRVEIKSYEGKEQYGHKYFVESSGARARPIYLKQSDKTGLLYVSNYSSLYVDVRPAIDENQEHFR